MGHCCIHLCFTFILRTRTPLQGQGSRPAVGTALAHPISRPPRPSAESLNGHRHRALLDSTLSTTSTRVALLAVAQGHSPAAVALCAQFDVVCGCVCMRDFKSIRVRVLSMLPGQGCKSSILCTVLFDRRTTTHPTEKNKQLVSPATSATPVAERSSPII